MTLPSVLADNPRLDRWLSFATPGKVELATGERLAEFVMDFAGDAGSLLLAYGLQIDRELAQALVGFSKLLFCAAVFDSCLGLTDSAIHRGNKPREPRFEHVIGSPAFECLDRNFFAHGAGNEDKRRLGAMFPSNFEGMVSVETRQGIVGKNEGRGTLL